MRISPHQFQQMSFNSINTKLCWWLYILIMSIDFTRTQSPIGGVFAADPFLELTAGATTPAIQKSTKLDPTCVSNGALAGAIIGTLIMSAFIAFLAWLIYLRPKFQELNYRRFHENRRIMNTHHHHHQNASSSNHKHSNRKQQIDDDQNGNELPLDVTDYKFGTFPFRQSQSSSANGHYNRTDWLNRISSSFRSVNMEQDSEMIDIELLDPTFGGLNFSITGNMRAGIFVKEILEKPITHKHMKSNSSGQLKPGDRIMALTVCFESIVYEDALTILSYASPYPVILRVQRPTNPVKVNVTSEKRPTTANSSNKVKWRDDFEHYDNDTPHNRSFIQPNPVTTTTNHLPPVPPNSKLSSSSPPNRSSSKKSRTTADTQPRKSSTTTTTKGNKIKKTASNTVLATSGATTKRSNRDLKKPHVKTNNNKNTQMMVMSTGLTSKPTISTNKKTVKSVTDAVISYLHYKGGGGGGPGGEHTTDVTNNNPETTVMPYYDSPYDYYYGGHASQYQYLHQSQLNKNNNNSLSTESLTAVTPNISTSVYTIQLSTIKSSNPNHQRRCQRRLSLPSIVTAAEFERTIINEHSIPNTDTFV